MGRGGGGTEWLGTCTDFDWLPVFQTGVVSLSNDQKADTWAKVLKRAEYSCKEMVELAAESLVATLERLGQPFVELMGQYCMTGDSHAVLSHQLDKKGWLAQPFQNSNQNVGCQGSNNDHPLSRHSNLIARMELW